MDFFRPSPLFSYFLLPIFNVCPQLSFDYVQNTYSDQECHISDISHKLEHLAKWGHRVVTQPYIAVGENHLTCKLIKKHYLKIIYALGPFIYSYVFVWFTVDCFWIVYMTAIRTQAFALSFHQSSYCNQPLII